MNIKEMFPEQLTNKQKYDLTMNPKTQKMKDAKGTVLEIAAWCVYIDTDKDGNDRQVLSILTPEREIYATNSATFMDDFDKMVDIFGAELTAIEVISGMSKNGREYITCAYAGE